jgi:hypothetical protein
MLKQDGQAFKVAETTYVTITFAPVEQKEGQRPTYPAKFKHDEGTFEVTVPTGTYRASILVKPEGKPSLTVPVDASKTYEINEDQQIDLELPK